LKNVPVSVTPFKSFDGETLPVSGSALLDQELVGEEFIDGTLIGMFYDTYSSQWRIHTRSTLDAVCRYYSPTKTFATMFEEATAYYNRDALNMSFCYSFVLQHPENRIVVPVAKPTVFTIQVGEITDKGTFRIVPEYPSMFGLIPKPVFLADKTTSQLYDLVNMHWSPFKHKIQGVMIKNNQGQRWKLRTPEYNRVRKLRGNSPRRDYIWLDLWRTGAMPEYASLFPEELATADATVNRWKLATADVHHYYTDVFKARTLGRESIPVKYRPLVYGLHTLYTQTLKPIGQTITWKTILQYMNERDTAQKLFVLNWDFRQANTVQTTIPIEAPVSVGTEVKVEA
jgi:hypothetical protein